MNRFLADETKRAMRPERVAVLRAGLSRRKITDLSKHEKKLLMKGGGIECDRVFERLVDDGDFEAGVRYGIHLMNRTDKKNNIQDGFELVNEGGMRGSAQGLYETGKCYDLGIGVEPDKDKAFEYYLRSFLKGYDVPYEIK